MTNTATLKAATSKNPVAAQKDLKAMLASPNIVKRLEEIIGKNTGSFCASLIQICNSNDMLKQAEPNTVISAAIVAATLNLPINNTLGFAYIVPFRNRKAGTTEAQFQIGYKGFIQLAMRSGQLKRLVVTEIYEKQIISRNPIKGYEFDFDITPQVGEPAVGFYAYMELVNGFIAESYMSVEQVQQHAAKYSQTYSKGYGVWKDNFDEMAKKTVLKLLLGKYAPMSIELQRATISDQAVIQDVPTDENVIDAAYYPDNSDDGSVIDVEPSEVSDKIQPDEMTFADIVNQIRTGDLSMESANAQYIFSAEQQAQLDAL